MRGAEARIGKEGINVAGKTRGKGGGSRRREREREESQVLKLSPPISLAQTFRVPFRSITFSPLLNSHIKSLAHIFKLNSKGKHYEHSEMWRVETVEL